MRLCLLQDRVHSPIKITVEVSNCCCPKGDCLGDNHTHRFVQCRPLCGGVRTGGHGEPHSSAPGSCGWHWAFTLCAPNGTAPGSSHTPKDAPLAALWGRKCGSGALPPHPPPQVPLGLQPPSSACPPALPSWGTEVSAALPGRN